MNPSPSRKRTLDQVSPPHLGHGSASPIPTALSPAAMAGGLSGIASVGPGASPIGADSPFTSALNQGTRMLSGINAPTPSNMPLGAMPGYDARAQQQGQTPFQSQMFLPQMQMQMQNGAFPTDTTFQQMAGISRAQLLRQQQQVRPEVALRISIDTLLQEVLPALERDGEAFYDALDGALGPNADARQVLAKRDQVLASLSNLTTFLQDRGLASLPLAEGTTEATDTDGSAKAASPADLEQETARLQALAREMFERRARLREAAAIVGGILDDQPLEQVAQAKAGKARKKAVTLALGPGTGSIATPVHPLTAAETPNAGLSTPSAAAK